MNGFSTEEDSRDGPPAAPFYGQSCCLIDDGDRCVRPAGNASFSKRIQKSISQKKLKLDIDKSVSECGLGRGCRALPSPRRGGRAGPGHHRTAVPRGRRGSARPVQLPGAEGALGPGLGLCAVHTGKRTAFVHPHSAWQRSGGERRAWVDPAVLRVQSRLFPVALPACWSLMWLKH